MNDMFGIDWDRGGSIATRFQRSAYLGHVPRASLILRLRRAKYCQPPITNPLTANR
jgi:hypothetical protein